jgi:putative ABC transport system permease protein
MGQMLGSYQIGLNFMSGIALFVGAFLIYNAFAMNVVERTREFGMLRTIGMTRSQIIVQVVAEAAFLGMTGSALGVLLGIGMANGLTRLMAVLLNQEIGAVQIPGDDLVSSLLVGIVTTMAAALLPAIQAGRISPLEALRARGQIKEPWLVRWGWILGVPLFVGGIIILVMNPVPDDPMFRVGSMAVVALFLGLTLLIPPSVSAWEWITRPFVRLLYGSTGQLGSRNIRRSRQRTTLTVAALMIGVSMVIVTSGMTGSFSADLEEWVASFLGGDLYVGSALPLRPEVRRKLEALPGVAAVAPMRQFNVEWVLGPDQTEKVVFTAFDPAAYTQVTKFTFSDSSVDQATAIRRLAEGGAVFLSSVLAEKFNVHSGDIIRLRTRSGLRTFVVAAEVVEFNNQGAVIQGNWNDMKRFFHIDDATTYLVKAQPGTDIEALKNQIDDLYGKRYHLILESNSSIRTRVLRLMNQAFAMFDVLALLSIVVASLGVMNTLTMNVIERTREIGMLRAIGMLRSQMVGMILAEAALLGLIGGGLGFATGIIQTRVFLAAMVKMSGYQLEFVMPTTGILSAVVIALLVSQLAAILPARRAARTRILDAIHYE